MARNRVKIIPLGGVDEVGKNMLVVEYKNDLLIIDAGLKFPEEEMLGIDLVIPDTTYLEAKKDKIRAILITHGHEDHAGALPYILSRFEAPIYSTKLTQGLISVKLKEYGLAGVVDQRLIEPGDVLHLGSFEVEFFHVSHSIPDGVGLIIRTPAGTIVHSGDFKFDQTPVDGLLTDFRKLAEVGSQGVLVLLCDCIRVERPGYTPSEHLVGDAFDTILYQAPGRVIITTFASNISRLQQVLDTAWKHGRRVAVVGRSLETSVSVATELGYLIDRDGTLVSLETVRRLPPERVILLTTGSQGEPTSALSRIASNEHPQIRIIPGDTVIISASPIPGNEETVARTIDNLFKRGAEVIYGEMKTVHVSGHASQEELKLMLNLLQPHFCVPIHGEYRHMSLFRKLAEEVGIPESNVLLPEIGQVLEFGDHFGRIAGKVPAGSVLVDGLTVGGISEIILRDRQHLSRDGVVIAVVALDKQTGKIVAGPDLISRGFLLRRDAEGLFDAAQEQVRWTLDQGARGGVEYGFIVQKIKEVLSQFLFERTGRRPMILPVVTEV
ncbi:MAG: ribonuclease J [Chloroflexi bacterium]|nr:ribonuclease J [Chloroflexota bacterium]